MKFSSLIIISILSLSSLGKAQSYTVKTDSVFVLELKSAQIHSILDSLLDHEDGCEYYSSDLILKIHMRQLKSDSTIIVFGSTMNLSTLGEDQVIGGFYWKGHYTEITGNVFKAELLRKTSKKISVKRHKPFEYHDPKKDKLSIEYLGESSNTKWYYIYDEHQQLSLIRKDSICP